MKIDHAVGNDALAEGAPLGSTPVLPQHVQLPVDDTHAQRTPDEQRSTRNWSYAALRTLEGVPHPLDDLATSRIVAAVLALLQRYSAQSELSLDLALLGRFDHARGARMRMTFEPETTFVDLEARVARELSAACELSELAPRSSNVALTFARLGASKTVHDIATFADDHDLHFVALEAKEHVALLLAYDASRFEAVTIERMLGGFCTLFAAALAEPGRALHDLPSLAVHELLEIERACEGPTRHAEDELVHERFARLAREQPHAVAVKHRQTRLTYAQLDQRSTELAQHLLARGVRRESMVAVCLAPSVDVLIALLGVMKAGAVYVPLDPSHPASLLALILDEVAPELVLTQQALAALLPEGTRCFCFDRDLRSSLALGALDASPVALDQACYVLYTSGTTGRPKGVVATHRNLAHYLGVARRRYGFTRDDVFCSLARYTFSISFFELLSPLTAGAQLIVLDRDDVLDPARLAAQFDAVTVLHAGPSLLGNLFRYLNKQQFPRAFPNVRHASSGGDAVPPELLEEMKRVFCSAELFVIYGCTEVSCMGCTAEVDRTRKVERTLVGKPFENVKVRVLDGRGNIVPFGVVGEVYFAGKGLAKRYLARPELTSEKFLCIDGQRFYRTGDLGRLSASGALELLGRSDFQVQIRGIRIELLGIERTAIELGLAAQCAVVAVRRDEQDTRLVAYFVDPRERDVAALRRALATRLPEYMLPQSFALLDALPLTANGKVDRIRLMQLAESAPLHTAREDGLWAAPEGATERAVAEAFAKVLKLDRVGRDDDFFALGGHSLSAVLLAEDLADRLGSAVSPSLLFERTTVRALAQALDGSAVGECGPILLSANGELPALFMLLGVHLYRALAEQLGEQYAVYGVYAAGELALLSEGRALCSVVELAREYVTIIRRQQPHGPYRLGGMSFGGIVAYEAAQQLSDAGEEVELLLLLDAVLPQTRVERARRLLEGASIGGLARDLGRRLRRARVASVGFEAFVGSAHDAALRPLEELRQHAYRQSATEYTRTAKAYAGDVTLVVAGERLARDRLLDPHCGFEPLVENLTVYTLPVDHLALLEAPAVAELARCVLRDTRRAGGRRCLVPVASRPPQLEQVA